MIPYDLDVDEATNIKLLRSELGHFDRRCSTGMMSCGHQSTSVSTRRRKARVPKYNALSHEQLLDWAKCTRLRGPTRRGLILFLL